MVAQILTPTEEKVQEKVKAVVAQEKKVRAAEVAAEDDKRVAEAVADEKAKLVEAKKS